MNPARDGTGPPLPGKLRRADLHDWDDFKRCAGQENLLGTPEIFERVAAFMNPNSCSLGQTNYLAARDALQ